MDARTPAARRGPDGARAVALAASTRPPALFVGTSAGRLFRIPLNPPAPKLVMSPGPGSQDPFMRGPEAYFFGKFGSAFTSSICAMCRLECAAMKSIHW